MPTLPSVKLVRECLDYDPKSGIAIWRLRPKEHFKTFASFKSWNTKFAHKEAGHLSDLGYLRCAINSELFMVHRLIWKMVTGNDPIDELDHRNGIGYDNRWKNLREASRLENTRNTRGKSKRNGLKGVTQYAPKRFKARITANRENIYLGSYKTPEEAHKAYRAAAAKLHGNFANY